MNVPPPRIDRRRVAWVNAVQWQADTPLTGARIALDVPQQRGIPLPWERELGALAEQTAAMLEALGASVLVTVGDLDQAASAARARMVHEFGADLLLCLRLGQAPSAHVRGLGAQVLGWGLVAGRRLARRLLDRVSQRTGLPVRANGWRPWVRGHGGGPTVRFECGCISAPADEALLQQEPFLLRCARGLTEGIMLYRGLPEHTVSGLSLFEAEVRLLAPPSPPPEPPPRLKRRLRVRRTLGAIAEPAPEQPAIAPEFGPSQPVVEEPATPLPTSAATEAATPLPAAAEPAALQLTPTAVGAGEDAPSRPATRHAVWQSQQRHQAPGLGGALPNAIPGGWGAGAAPPPVGEGAQGPAPTPMLQTAAGGWISPKALELLRQHQMAHTPQPEAHTPQPEAPRGESEAHLPWHSVPPEFRRDTSRRFDAKPEPDPPL